MNDPADERDLATLTGRAQLPAEVRAAGGLRQLDYILNLPAPAELVGELAVEELYLLLQDIGTTDAYPLLEHASDEQLVGLVDLDAWHRDGFDIARFVSWLDLSLAVDVDTGLRFLGAQDDETLEWLFMDGDIEIHASDLDPSDVPDDREVFQSPDGMYWVTVPGEHPLVDRIPQLLKLLWAQDGDRARVLFQQARVDLGTSVTDYMTQFRDGRLQDIGFDSLEGALAVFSRRDPKALRAEVRAKLAEREPLRPAHVGVMARDLVLSGVAAPDLFARALARLDAPARARFGEAFTFLVNRVFQALTGDLSRTDDLPIAARHAASLLNVGLAFVADEDEETASLALERVWPLELFQVGYTLALDLAVRARRVLARAGQARGLTLFGSPVDETLGAVALGRPMLFEGLTDPGLVGVRPFATLDELARVEVVLADAEAVIDFVEARFGVTPEAILDSPALAGLDADARRRVRLATLLRTGFANLLLTDQLAFTPLDRSALQGFARAAFEKTGELSPLLRGAQAKVLEAAPPAVARLVEGALDALVMALGRVRPEDLDPRYAGELFLVAPDADDADA
ncbi:MAG: hypothetical protein KC635_13500 [Myxococcales bacterium]|nr:hypothetical protein [Myxococcales bacterium]